MKFLVFGAGAVGSILGARLARCGHWVTLVGRPIAVETICKQGLSVDMPDGTTWTTRRIRAVDSLAEAAQGADVYAPSYDAILLCVKAYDVGGVVADLQAAQADTLSTQGTRLVCFQNGVGSEERVAVAFGASRIVAATFTSPVTMAAPGRVRLERAGGGIGLAPLAAAGPPDALERRSIPEPGRIAPDPFTQLCDTLRETLIPIRCYADYRAMKWSKMLLNIVANASGAILNWTPRQVYADRRTFGLELDMLRETLGVMRAANIPVVNLPGAPAAAFGRLVQFAPSRLLQPLLAQQVARGRGDKRPSFHGDVPVVDGRQSGRGGRCEIAHLNGEIARQARALGVAAPVNERLTDILTALVEGRARPDEWQDRPDQLVEACRAGSEPGT